MLLYDLFDEFAAQIFLIALVAISRMRNVPLKLERKNLSEILTEGIKKKRPTAWAFYSALDLFCGC